jgi:hypothetical protein
VRIQRALNRHSAAIVGCVMALPRAYYVRCTQEQEATKKQKLEIVYSYWDGSGHRRTITVPKGTTVGKFLEWVRQDLVEAFPEMRNVSGDQLLYVKVRRLLLCY